MCGDVVQITDAQRFMPIRANGAACRRLSMVARAKWTMCSVTCAVDRLSFVLRTMQVRPPAVHNFRRTQPRPSLFAAVRRLAPTGIIAEARH
jgi:hypothetical protein